MAEQLTDRIYYPGDYVDKMMSTETFKDLSDPDKFPRGRKFVGLTVTVKEEVKTPNGDFVPVDVWLSENKNGWVVKNIAPIDNLDCLNAIPNEYMYIGFKVVLKNGDYYILTEITEGKYSWERELDRTEFDSTIADTVETAVNEAIAKVSSGASEAFDTLKEIEEWINASGSTDISGLVDDVNALKDKAHTHDNKDVLDEIDSERVTSWDNSKNASGTFLDESITVTRDAGNYTNGMTIEEGTSVLDVLKNFFHKTLYPNVATKPSAKLELNGLLESEYEVGSVIEIPAVSVITEDGKFNYTDYKGVMVQGGEFYEISIKSEIISGFKNFDTNNIEEAQSNIVVSEGNNEILYTAIAKYEAPSNKPTTNEGVETTHTNANLNDNAATWEKGEIEMTLTVKVDGYKNVYFGTTNDKSEISEDLIKSLNASNKVITEDMELTTSTKNDDNHNRMIIAVPENKTLQLVEDSTSTQDLTKLILITEKKIEISSKNGLESVIYNVYDKAWAGSFGNETWKIKIKNK